MKKKGLKEQLIDTELKLKNIRRQFKNLHMKYTKGIDVDMYHDQAKREQCYVEKIIALKAIMKNKKHKIKIPEGYEVESVVTGNIVTDEGHRKETTIQFKPIKKELLKTWEEYISINKTDWDRGFFVDEKYYIAFDALRKLIELRDHYNDGWVPDWTDLNEEFSIENHANELRTRHSCQQSKVFTFKSRELRNEFLSNFRELIETAKPLL